MQGAAGERSAAHAGAGKPARGFALVPRGLRYYRVWRRFRADTMIPRDAYLANLYLADKALARAALAAGAVVECGTWRGGMAAGLALIGGSGRDYHFFDSFAGLPPAGDEDGAAARRAQRTGDGIFHDNNSASLADFRAVIARAGLPPPRLHIHRGWFADTVPGAVVGPIAVLRLDGDWYDSTRICLDALWPLLLPGALVLIDDYYAWEGCTKAVHDVLSARRASEPIRESRFGKVAYLIKR